MRRDEQERAEHKPPQAGARFGWKLAAASLAFVFAYCCGLSVLHARAQGYAEQFAADPLAANGDRVVRVAATPTAANPRVWRCLAETTRSTFRFDVVLGDSSTREPLDLVAYEKPSGEAATLVSRASTDGRARVLLDFARFPVARVRRNDSGGWVVQFADIRFTEPGSRRSTFALDVPIE